MDDETIALEFAADVEDAVANVREFTGVAQGLADTAKEAADGCGTLTESAADLAGATQGLSDEVYETGAALSEEAAAAKAAAGAAGDVAAAQVDLKAATADARTAVAELGQVQADAGKESAEYAGQLDVAAAAMQRQAAAADQLKAAQEAQASAAAEASSAAEASAGAQEGAATASDTAADASTAAGDAQAASAAKTDTAAAAAAEGGLGKYKMALLGVAVGAGVAVDGAVKYQAETTRLVTSAGESASQLNNVRQGMLELSAQTDTSTSELSSGMYLVESAGYHGAAGLNVLKASAQGAKDEGAELSTVANGVTDALVDFHEPASDAANVTSQLIAGVSKGKTTFEEFSGSMSNILPLASSMHLQLADVTGVLAEMTAHGMSAQRASEDEANAMRSLMAPTATMSTEYKALGISTQEMQAHLGKDGLAGTMQWLSGVAKSGAGAIGQSYNEALYKLMGTAPGLQVALMNTGENAKSTDAAIKGIASASADASGNVDGFAQVSQTASFKLGAAKESAEAMGISLGEALLPAVTAVIGPITSMMQLIAGNRAASIAFAVVIGGILAGALGVKLAGALKDAKEGITVAGEGVEWLVGKLTGAKAAQDGVTASTEAATAATEAQTGATEAATVAQEELDVAEDANPVGLIIIAIVALIAVIVLLITHWHDVEEVASAVWHGIAEGFDTVRHAAATAGDAIAKPFEVVFDWIKANWKLILAWLVDPIGMAVFEIRTHTHEIAQSFDEARHDVAAVIDGIGHDVESGFDTVRHDIAAFADWLPTEVEHGFEDAHKDAVAAAEALVHDVESSFDELRHDAAAGVDDVVSYFEKLPGEVLHELEALPGQMLTAGENAVLGLLHGVEDIAGELLGEVSNLAGDVEKAFTDPLSILSPSKVMYQHGADYVNGIIGGVQSRASALTGAVGALATGIGAPGAAIPAGSTMTHTVDVNVNSQGVAVGDPLQSPQYQQELQAAVQEVTLRYADMNPGNGLSPTWGRG